MKNLIEQKIAEIRAMNDWRTITAIGYEETLNLVAKELNIDVNKLKEIIENK